MNNTNDYLFISDALANSSQQLGKQINCALVLTPQNIYMIPYKSVGVFGILGTISTHKFFENKSIKEGIQDLINSKESISTLESELNTLLEGDSRYVYPVKEAKSIKVMGFLGKKTTTYRKSLTNYMSFSPKLKEEGKQLKIWVKSKYNN